MDFIYDVIIIGAGPAGCTAGIYCASAGLKTVVFDQLGPGGQMNETTNIENYPGYPEGIDGITLGHKMKNGLLEAGCEYKTQKINSIDLIATPKIIASADNVHYAKSVIIATGAKPRKANIPCENRFFGKGVHYCATCDGAFYRGKDIIVLGGGNSAAEEALYLSALCKKVTLVHRGSTLRANNHLQTKMKQKENIQFLLNSVIESINGIENLSRITILQGDRRICYPCDGIFISIGRDPETSLVSGQLAMNDRKYILTDETMKTSMPGVFAAGDVREKAVRQIVTATSDGAIAANSAISYLQQL